MGNRKTITTTMYEYDKDGRIIKETKIVEDIYNNDSWNPVVPTTAPKTWDVTCNSNNK